MNDTKSKAPRERSPAFPFISLKAATERLEQFSKKFGRHPVPANKVGLAWEMKPESSQAAQTLAALKAFGFLDYEGSGSNRVAILTADGRNYLRAQQEEIKSKILKRAALAPKNFHRFWEFWGGDRPIDEICLDELVLKYQFNEKAAPTFLRVYDETIAYAGLVDSDKIPPDDNGDDEGPEDEIPPEDPLPPEKKVKKLMAGERELSSGLLSKEANYRVIVSGEVGLKEINRLIAKLTLDKEILADKDDDDSEDEEKLN